MSSSVLQAGADAVRAIANVVQVRELYPEQHPTRVEAVHEAVEALGRWHDHARDRPLYATRGSLYADGHLLAQESIRQTALVQACADARVDALQCTGPVSPADIEHLTDLLVAGATERKEHVFGGLRLNALAPSIRENAEAKVELDDVKRAYSRSMQALRDTTSAVAGGGVVDLGAATSAVSNLSTEVSADSDRALILTTVRAHDELTYHHMVNTCLLTIVFAQALGLRDDQVISLGLGALLHDIGKVNLPSEVLNHPGKLDEEQWRLIQKHPVDGAGLLFATSDGLYHPAASIVLEHHSAYDLSGYPSLSRRDMPSLAARLVSVVDCFDAVTSKRPYRAPAERAEALAILEAGAGRGFDPRLVRIFVSLMGVFPVGSVVQLDTGQIAVVVRSKADDLARPVCVEVVDALGNTAALEEIDLSAKRPDGQYWRSVVAMLSADEMGLDIPTMLSTGEVTEITLPAKPNPGLVHEPSHGEAQPDGYVDTHAEAHAHGHSHDHTHAADGLVEDPDIHPPIDDA